MITDVAEITDTPKVNARLCLIIVLGCEQICIISDMQLL